MKNEHQLYMTIAKHVAKQSYAEKLQVGAIIVKEDRVISIGYNGTPRGWDNVCEDKIPKTYGIASETDDTYTTYELKTKPEVLHAETNAIAKVAQSSESSKDGVLYTTCAPCLDCAKLIYQSGITKVVYGHPYRTIAGIDFLLQSGLEVISYNAD